MTSTPTTALSPCAKDREVTRARLRFLIKASRPGFYSTAVWFYLLTVAQQPVWFSPRFYLGALYCTFPFGLLLYGWNDVGDRVTDRHNPRKDSYLFGARGSDTDLAQLPRQIAWAQAPFLALFALLIGPLPTLLWFAALVGVNYLYNNPPFRFKSRPGLELLNQAGYLLVFVLGTRLNQARPLPWQTYVFAALFAMHSHLFGQIMDVAPDRAAGRRTTAAVIGVVPAKVLLISILAFEAAFVFHYFHSVEVTAFLALAALYFLADTAVLFRARPYPPRLLEIFALGLNAATLGSMGWIWATGCLSLVR
jgi:4-hydroxybenzoate polyprenyltransferase